MSYRPACQNQLLDSVHNTCSHVRPPSCRKPQWGLFRQIYQRLQPERLTLCCVWHTRLISFSIIIGLDHPITDGQSGLGYNLPRCFKLLHTSSFVYLRYCMYGVSCSTSRGTAVRFKSRSAIPALHNNHQNPSSTRLSPLSRLNGRSNCTRFDRIDKNFMHMIAQMARIRNGELLKLSAYLWLSFSFSNPLRQSLSMSTFWNLITPLSATYACVRRSPHQVKSH